MLLDGERDRLQLTRPLALGKFLEVCHQRVERFSGGRTQGPQHLPPQRRGAFPQRPVQVGPVLVREAIADGGRLRFLSVPRRVLDAVALLAEQADAPDGGRFVARVGVAQFGLRRRARNLDGSAVRVVDDLRDEGLRQRSEQLLDAHGIAAHSHVETTRQGVPGKRVGDSDAILREPDAVPIGVALLVEPLERVVGRLPRRGAAAELEDDVGPVLRTLKEEA